MLILTRRINEKLMIGDDIEVAILGIKGNQVRVGIKAPYGISVHREEIYEKIQRGKECVSKDHLVRLHDETMNKIKNWVES